MGEQEIIDLIENVLDSALERIELKELDEATSLSGLFTMGTTSTGSSYKVPMPLMKGEAPVLTVEIDERGHLVVDVEYKVWDTIPPIVFADPEVVNILFTNGLISNPTYSTKEELALITDDGFAVYDAPNDSYTGIFNGTSITSLNELQYFKGLTFLGERYFYGSGIVSIIIPDGITNLGDECFSDCSSLTSIIIPDSVTSIGYSCFEGCWSLTSVTIPDNVTSIEDYCFSACESLTSITIPDNVTNIGTMCFSYCPSLTTITLESITPPTLGSYVFDSTVEKFFVPDESVASYKAASGWIEHADKIFPIT